MDADAAVSPYGDEQCELARQIAERVAKPEQVEHPEIGILQTIEQDAKPGVGYMRDEEQRNRKAETKLPGFDRRHTQVPASIERGQPEAEMNEKSGEQDRKPHGRSPRGQQNILADPLNAIEQEQAGRMAEQVAGRVAEHDQAAREPDRACERQLDWQRPHPHPPAANAVHSAPLK
jgi:hypothetical protein